MRLSPWFPHPDCLAPAEYRHEPCDVEHVANRCRACRVESDPNRASEARGRRACLTAGAIGAVQAHVSLKQYALRGFPSNDTFRVGRRPM